MSGQCCSVKGLCIVWLKMNRASDTMPDKPPERPKRKIKAAARNYENVIVQKIALPAVKAPVPVPRITALPWDSDDDPICSASESLENEIFKELERASFDEEKLNEAIKNFDKILNDYKEEEEKQSIASALLPTATKTPIELQAARPEKPRRSSDTPSNRDSLPAATAVDVNVLKGKSKIPLSRQVLTKSKTCSIIESKCILKKSLSHDGDLSRCMKMQSPQRIVAATPITTNKKPVGANKGYKKLPIDHLNSVTAKEAHKNVVKSPPVNNCAPSSNKAATNRPPKESCIRPVGKVFTPEIRPANRVLTRAKSEWDVRGSRIPVKQLSVVTANLPPKYNVTRSVSVGLDQTDSSVALEKCPSKIQYAKVVSASNPKMESCKVIPAVPFSGTPKDKPTPVPVKDASKFSVSKVCKLLLKAMPDQDYHSDNSDDSGHISNEHDESTASSSADTVSPFGCEKVVVESPGRISGELLKYFDSSLEDVSKSQSSKTSPAVSEIIETEVEPHGNSLLAYLSSR